MYFHETLLLLLLLCWCFTALRYFSCHFWRGQLACPHCSWTSLLGRWPVFSGHSFASNWKLPFLNQRKGENDRRNYFMTKLHERMLLDLSIEPASAWSTVRIPGGRGSDRAPLPAPVIVPFWHEKDRVIMFYRGQPLLILPVLDPVVQN